MSQVAQAQGPRENERRTLRLVLLLVMGAALILAMVIGIQRHGPALGNTVGAENSDSASAQVHRTGPASHSRGRMVIHAQPFTGKLASSI